MHDCIFLMLFSIFATRPSICSRFVTFKVAASLPRRASDQRSVPGQLPGINAGGLRGGTPRKCSPFHMTGQPLRRAVVKMELHDGQEASEAVARTPHVSLVCQPFLSMNVSCLWMIVFFTGRLVKPRFRKDRFNKDF